MNLLPAGFYDVLTPDAQREAAAIETLLSRFAEQGYGRVSPPMMEFEETLLSGPGAALNRTTFRVMDPAAQRMLACRSDHTLQIGRIAATRLLSSPRPLRLSYAGPIVRLSAHEQNPARQMTQVGAELIGSLDAEADAEVMMLAVQSLSQTGIKDVSVDITLPTLVPSLCDAFEILPLARSELHHALDRKDEALVQALSKTAGLEKLCGLALALLRASGDARKAVKALTTMDLPQKAALDRTRLIRVLELLPADMIEHITVDLVEYRGFEYQTGLSFAIFSKSTRKELGRGGRYRTASQEPATGFTFYAESLMPVLPPTKPRPSILVAFETSAAQCDALVKEGYVVLRCLKRSNDLTTEAKRQQCQAVLENGKAKAV
ncbi:MAG: ATP phosphoribosyltransferase regulatory subunit [Alphaproteobacteria bacterium]|nr:ATP phosphoribosyltransferase regulatory subunit [Alphaproteobacteria bacterium]